MPTYYPNRRAREAARDTGDKSSTRRAAAVPDPVVSDPVPDLVVSAAAAPAPVPDPVVSSSSDVALPAASTTRHDARRDGKRKRPETVEAGADVDGDAPEGSRKRAAAASAANRHAQQQHLESSLPKKKKKRRTGSVSSGKVGQYKKGKRKGAYTYERKTDGTSGAGTAADDDEDGPEVVFVPPADAAGTSGAGTAAAPTLAVAPMKAAPPVPAPPHPQPQQNLLLPPVNMADYMAMSAAYSAQFSPMGFAPMGFPPMGFPPMAFAPMAFAPMGFAESERRRQREMRRRESNRERQRKRRALAAEQREREMKERLAKAGIDPAGLGLSDKTSAILASFIGRNPS